jgi:hypothetical protein
MALGIEPKLYLSWSVVPQYWQGGYTLMIFHSVSGFCPERYPDDLNLHGQLIIETLQDDCREIRPQEGTHYYTFVLHKKCFLGLSEKLSILRVSETIPSAQVPLGRIRDKCELEDMRRRHELAQIEHEARVNEAEIRRIRSREKLALAQEPPQRKSGTDAFISEELSGIDAMVEALIAKRKKIQELKQDPRFRKLRREEREEILQLIDDRLDAGEISARREKGER